MKTTGVVKYWRVRAEYKGGWREHKCQSWEDATEAFRNEVSQKPIWAVVWAVSGQRNNHHVTLEYNPNDGVGWTTSALA